MSERRGYYRGMLTWRGVTAPACVCRPDHSPLDPLPVKFVEKLIRLRWKPWKYG